MTREQALNKIIEGFNNLKNAEEQALADNATVIDYCFKSDRIVKLNLELTKRCRMMIKILEAEAQTELDMSSDKELQVE